jgi:hypothetical protein
MVEKHGQELNLAPIMEVLDDLEVSSDDDSSDKDSVVFVLDKIPGAPDAEDIIIEMDDDEDENVEVDEVSEEWGEWEPKTFLPWLDKMFNKVPKHSGYDTTGLEKAIAHFEALDKEITKAMRSDYKNEIDSAKAERAREQIENGLDRLIERLEQVKQKKYKRHAKKKKGWAESSGLVKEAGTTNITGITITVPLFISRIARVCINGMVSAGHDIEDMFDRQVKEYNLDKREQAELSQLLSDMGYAMVQDRGYLVGERVDMRRNDNFDWSAQYRG